MDPEEFTPTTPRLSRRRTILVASPVLVALLVVWVVVARDGIADADATTTRIVTGTVTTRTLVATTEVDGTVQRASRFQVAYGSTGASLMPDGSTGTGAASETSKSASSASNVSGQSSGTANFGTAASATTSSTAVQVVFTSVVEPTPEPSPSASPEATPTPTPSATPTPKPTSMPVPTPKPSPTSRAPSDGQATGGSTGPISSPKPKPSPTSRAPSDGQATGGLTGQVQSGASTATGSPSGTSTFDGAGQVTVDLPAATLTQVTALGSPVKAGTVLYASDGQPVVALLGDAVFWRDLEVGVGDGNDVRVLERNLQAMGYGGGLTVDSSFTTVTASAVEQWEKDLGRSDPNGVVTLGDVVVVGSATEVSAQLAQVGDTLRTGGVVLNLSSNAQIVAAHVSADDVTAWTSGTPVMMTWSDGATAAATVVSVGRDVVDGEVAITVASDAAAAARVSGTPVTVSLTVKKSEGVLAAPVSAIRSGKAGGPAVLVLDGSTLREIAVTTGIVAGGWVEVAGGLVEGQEVVLPG